MPTWSDIKTEIKDQYDLNEELFITDTELLAYANEAIEVIENRLIASNEKYFRAPWTLSLIADLADYSLPTDIYANKFEVLHYNYNGKKYEVKRIKDLNIIPDIEDGDDYSYLIINTTASGTKIRIYPTPGATETSAIQGFYVRNITRFTSDSTELDVPEAKAYVKQYITDKAANKERMTPDAPKSPKLQQLEDDLMSALSTMIIDNNNEILMDTGYYDDAEGFLNGG